MADPKRTSHKKKKRKRNDPQSNTTAPVPETALVTAEKAKKPKKMDDEVVGPC
jgi:hypothetical protein